ncbi:hypothetical protein [Olsenella profusa]|uniref:hypothetical protein n=1 Tax=Olsenella profusa TaxID=138595 RepID=UPI0018DEB0DA|nr:hypothetical protein [Olsenella profusa]
MARTSDARTPPSFRESATSSASANIMGRGPAAPTGVARAASDERVALRMSERN